MFEIVFLGTSASAPSIYRGLSSQVVIYKEHRFLVDCGEGTQRQILQSGLGFRKLDKIFLTHSHLDHVLGLAGLLSTFSRWEALEKIEIWGGRPTLERVRALIFGVVLKSTKSELDISLREVKGAGVLYEEDDLIVSAFPVEHRGAGCYGYTFQQKDRRPFLNEKAEALHVPQGPERRDLVLGQAITLADGRTIYPDDVLGEAIPGTKLCLTGDYTNPYSIQKYISEADLLVSEATFSEEERDLARQFGHVTAQQAAELARDSGVRNLVLTHISRRYRERDLISEARSIFPNTILARDFDHYQIKQGQPLEQVETIIE